MCCWKRLHSKSHQLSSGWQMRIFKPMTFTFVYFLCCSSSCLLSWRRIHNEYLFPLKRRHILWSAESPNKVGEGGTKMPAHVTRHHVATRAAFVSRLLARLTLTQRAVTEESHLTTLGVVFTIARSHSLSHSLSQSVEAAKSTVRLWGL